MINSLIGAVVKTAVIFLLASQPSFGITRAALGIIVGFVLVTILHFATVLKKIAFSFYIRDYAKAFIAMGISGWCGYWLFGHFLINQFLAIRLRELTSRSAGKSLREVIEQVNQKFTGWIQYFRMARMKGLMQDIGQWLRRRLRCLRLKQCKRAYAIAQFLMSLGEREDSAWMLALSGKGWWRLADTPQSHRAMNLRWFQDTGLIDPEAAYLAVRNAC